MFVPRIRISISICCMPPSRYEKKSNFCRIFPLFAPTSRFVQNLWRIWLNFIRFTWIATAKYFGGDSTEVWVFKFASNCGLVNYWSKSFKHSRIWSNYSSFVSCGFWWLQLISPWYRYQTLLDQDWNSHIFVANFDLWIRPHSTKFDHVHPGCQKFLLQCEI